MDRYVVRLREEERFMREVTVEAKGISWDYDEWVVRFHGEYGPVAYFNVGNVISIIQEGASPA